MCVHRFNLSTRTASLDFFFFFQAEDGIRDLTVTGVQTCALPISERGEVEEADPLADGPVLGADAVEARRARPAPAALIGARAATGCARHEIVGALPAVLLAEHGAGFAESCVER